MDIRPGLYDDFLTSKFPVQESYAQRRSREIFEKLEKALDQVHKAQVEAYEAVKSLSLI